MRKSVLKGVAVLGMAALASGLMAVSAGAQSLLEKADKGEPIRIGFANPQAEGMLVCVVTTSAAAARRLGDGRLKDLPDSLSGLPCVDVEAVRRVLVAHPDGPGLWGPHAHLYMEGGDAATTATTPGRTCRAARAPARSRSAPTPTREPDARPGRRWRPARSDRRADRPPDPTRAEGPSPPGAATSSPSPVASHDSGAGPVAGRA